MFLSLQQNVEKYRDIIIANTPFRNVEQLEYFGKTVTDENFTSGGN
jgi:hypothetical protein